LEVPRAGRRATEKLFAESNGIFLLFRNKSFSIEKKKSGDIVFISGRAGV